MFLPKFAHMLPANHPMCIKCQNRGRLKPTTMIYQLENALLHQTTQGTPKTRWGALSWNIVSCLLQTGNCYKEHSLCVWSTAGQFGVHLVREISPWSSQVLCIGLAQNLKPILSDDKYWNINPNISAFGMWLICDNTWMYNIQAFAWMYHIQAFAWPQIWPNPIPNPIHGCNAFKIFEHIYALKYQQKWPNPISNPIHWLAIIKF